MSKLAAEYYQARADQLGAPVPPFLDGQPVPLLQSAEFLSIRTIQAEPHVPSVGDELYTLLSDTTDFLSAGLPGNELLPHYDPDAALRCNESFSNNAVAQQLMPGKKIPTGKLRNIQIEAIAREEVVTRDLDKLRGQSRGGVALFEGEDNETTEAYFALTGEIFTGSQTISVRGLTAALLVLSDRHQAVAPIFRGTRSAINERVVRSAARTMRATGGLTNPRVSGSTTKVLTGDVHRARY